MSEPSMSEPNDGPPPIRLLAAAEVRARELVDHPAHYGGAGNPYEAIRVIEAWGLGFHLGNAVKYIARAGRKPGTPATTDLRKARWYLERMIDQEGLGEDVAWLACSSVDDPAALYAHELEAALLDLVGAANPVDADDAKLRALAVLDAIGDARCSAGLCGHDADDGCAAWKDEDGDDALLVQPEGP